MDIEKKTKIKFLEYQLEIKSTQWPIVYCPVYNISFWGLEKLHPFDSKKWGRIYKRLKEAGMLTDDTIVEPLEISEEELLCVHSQTYLGSLKWSVNVARITEVAVLFFLPNCFVQRKVLRPFRYQTSGTILAARLAIERGWAINIGGGFHHCSANRGGGFCAYADITLAIKFAMGHFHKVRKVMIVDLDAHQGNGYARDFMGNSHVYIFDVYNRDIYPNDIYAKDAISRKVEVRSYIKDSSYLKLVKGHLDSAIKEFTPHLVIYNAGTDILEYDPLGSLCITPKGVIERDRIVFEKCRSLKIPIVMLTSGGYLTDSAKVVSDSILNLWREGYIALEEPNENHKIETSSRRGLCAGFRQLCCAGSSSSLENPESGEQPGTSLEPSAGSSSSLENHYSGEQPGTFLEPSTGSSSSLENHYSGEQPGTFLEPSGSSSSVENHESGDQPGTSLEPSGSSNSVENHESGDQPGTILEPSSGSSTSVENHESGDQPGTSLEPSGSSNSVENRESGDQPGTILEPSSGSSNSVENHESGDQPGTILEPSSGSSNSVENHESGDQPVTSLELSAGPA